MIKFLGTLLLSLGIAGASLKAQGLKDLGLGGVLAVGYELEYEMPTVGFGFQFDGRGMTVEIGMTENLFAIGGDFDFPILRIYDYTFLSTGFGLRIIEDDKLARINLGILLGKVRLKVSHGWVFTGAELKVQEDRATMVGLQLLL